MQLARKFLIAVVVIAMGVIAIGVWASLRSEAELLLGDIRRDHARLGQTLARAVERVPKERLAEEGPEVARSLLPEHERLKARLLRVDDPSERPTDQDVFNEVMSARTPVFAAVSERAGMYITVVPLSVPGMAIELREPVENESGAMCFRRIALRYAFIILSLTAGFVVTITYMGRRFIGEPMKLLVSQARSIGAGKLDETTPLRQDDEIGQLAHELNTTASRLREADERARAENEKRLQAVEQLRHADRLATVGTLASGIAHELGTPLAVVQGRASLIEDASADPDVAKSARVICEQVERMSRIIRQVLDFARRTPPQATRVPLCDLVEKTISFLSSVSRKHSVQIRITDRSPTFVLADPGLIHQVFTNLLMNAVQASIGRSNEVLVRITEAVTAPPGQPASAARRYGRVEVEDRGKGIPAEHLKHVFEPFFTTKDVGEGTGLGLSVAWGIVHDHDGFIDVESKINEGSVFRVHLPRAADA